MQMVCFSLRFWSRFTITLMAAIALIAIIGAGLLGSIAAMADADDRRSAQSLLSLRAVQLQAVYQTSESALRLQVASDPLVRSLALLDTSNELIYPQPGNIVHVTEQRALDDRARLRQLAARLPGASVVWERRDFNADELYFCTQVADTVCLIVATQVLADAISTSPDQLLLELDQSHPGMRAQWPVVPLLLCLLVIVGVSIAARRMINGRHRPQTLPDDQTISSGDGFTMADMIVRPAQKLVQRGPLQCAINERDLKILRHLYQRPNQVISKDELYDIAWGREFVPSSRALEQHIINLRRKLDPDKTLPTLIETVHGQGYRYPVNAQSG